MSTHQAEFHTLYNADSTVTNLSLSVDSFDSSYVWDDLFSGRTASSDSNALLTKLDQGFDYIVYLGSPAYQQDVPELTMATLMFLQRYLKSMNSQIVLPVLWNATNAAAHTGTFEEHAYRIGDALGLDVVPAGLAWDEFDRHSLQYSERSPDPGKSGESFSADAARSHRRGSSPDSDLQQ